MVTKFNSAEAKKKRKKGEKVSSLGGGEFALSKEVAAEAGKRKSDPYTIGDKKYKSKQEYEKAKGAFYRTKGIQETPEGQPILEKGVMPGQTKESIKGLFQDIQTTPEAQETIAVTGEQEQQTTFGQGFLEGLTPEQFTLLPKPIQNLITQQAQTKEQLAGQAAGELTRAGAALGVVGLAGGFSVGGTTYASTKSAIQAGNTAKTISQGAPAMSKLTSWTLSVFATLGIGEKLLNLFSPDKIDEQQQAINTIGQMATTIGGQATEATGDWRKGLNELYHIRNKVLEAEKAIKEAGVRSIQIKYNGKIYDIDADIADQLSTIDEQITIVQSFVVSQSFPELSELEIQNHLRILESEGFIKPVDLTSARR